MTHLASSSTSPLPSPTIPIHHLPPELLSLTLSYLPRILPLRLLSRYFDGLILQHVNIPHVKMLKVPREKDYTLRDNFSNCTEVFPSVPKRITHLLVSSQLCSNPASLTQIQHLCSIKHVSSITFAGIIHRFALSQWRRCSYLDSISFRSGLASLDLEDESEAMSQLRSLHVHSLHIPNHLKVASFINMLGKLPNLRRLRLGELSGMSWSNLERLMRVISQMPLTHLHIGWIRCDLDPRDRARELWERGGYEGNMNDSRNDISDQKSSLRAILSRLIHKLSPTLESLNLGSFYPSSILSPSLLNSIHSHYYQMISHELCTALNNCRQLRHLDLHISNEAAKELHSLHNLTSLESLSINFDSSVAPLHLAPPTTLKRLHLYFSKEFSLTEAPQFVQLTELHVYGVFNFNNGVLLQLLAQNANSLTYLELTRADTVAEIVAQTPSLTCTGPIEQRIMGLHKLQYLVLVCHSVRRSFAHKLGTHLDLRGLSLEVRELVDSSEFDEEHSPTLHSLRTLVLGDRDSAQSLMMDPVDTLWITPNLRHFQWSATQISLHNMPTSTSLPHISSITIHCTNLRDLNLHSYPHLESLHLYSTNQTDILSFSQISELIYKTRHCDDFFAILHNAQGTGSSFGSLLAEKSIKKGLEHVLETLESYSSTQLRTEDERLLAPLRILLKEWIPCDDAEIRAKYSIGVLDEMDGPSSYKWLVRECLLPSW